MDVDDVVIFIYVKENVCLFSFVIGNVLWKVMEKSLFMQYLWQFLKDCYFKYLWGQEYKYLLGDVLVSFFFQKFKWKVEEDLEVVDSGELQNKRILDLFEEEYVKEEIQENEEVVKKMFVEVIWEFEEVVVDESFFDFEIYIIMCDDDLFIFEEDLEIQFDEEEEEEEEKVF